MSGRHEGIDYLSLHSDDTSIDTIFMDLSSNWNNTKKVWYSQNSMYTIVIRDRRKNLYSLDIGDDSVYVFYVSLYT